MRYGDWHRESVGEHQFLWNPTEGSSGYDRYLIRAIFPSLSIN